MRHLGRTLGGVATAVRARPAAFAAGSLGVAVLGLLGPPLVLSLARKPVDYVTVNPWLQELPAYLAADGHSWSRKLEAVWNLALIWCSADSPHGGVEWGFAVDVGDGVRILGLALLGGACLALWAHGRTVGGGLAGGTGTLASVLGLSTGPCSVMGCGAPVIPVVGLAFTGLTSGTLGFLASASRVATAVAFVGLAAAVSWGGWRVGGAAHRTPD